MSELATFFDFVTPKCIRCGAKATILGGHLHIEGDRTEVTAGWCPECDHEDRGGGCEKHSGGCYGQWDESMGLAAEFICSADSYRIVPIEIPPKSG